MNIKNKSSVELMNLYAEILAELNRRNVVRTYNQFDYLIIVIFNDRFGVKEGYMLPHDTIKPYARYNKHQNGYILMAKGAVLSDKSTLNITDQLQ